MKLKAATIIESLIAMVILVTIMGTATMIFTNGLNSDKQRKKLRASSLIAELRDDILKEKRFVDTEIIKDEWVATCSFEKVESSERLYQMKIYVTEENGKLVLEQNELILIP